MMDRAVTMVVIGAVAAVGLGACGDDDDRLSKAAYVRQANEICSSADEEFNRIFETGFPVTRGALSGFFEQATPIIREQLRELRALEPPEADDQVISSMLEELDAAVDDFVRAEDDADFGARLFSEEGGEHLKAFEEQAAAYDLTDCAEDEEDEEPQRLDPSTFSAEKRAYVEQADAICASSNERFSAVEESLFAEFPPTLENWAEGLPQFVEIIREQLTELRKLTPPAGDREKITGLLDQAESLAKDLEDAIPRAEAGDEEAFAEKLGPAFGGFEELDIELVEYGFQVCGPTDDDGGGEDDAD